MNRRRGDGRLWNGQSTPATRLSRSLSGLNLKARMIPTENETWLIEIGDEIIKRRAADGKESVPDVDNLIFCLWVADYGMRNAGDLAGASQVDADFHTDGARLSKSLELPATQHLFGLNSTKFHAEYFDRFESVCDELKSARR